MYQKSQQCRKNSPCHKQTAQMICGLSKSIPAHWYCSAQHGYCNAAFHPGHYQSITTVTQERTEIEF